MKIYTKTGDKGETSLYGGKRVSKADLRVESYGTVDELNSAIGLTIAVAQNSKLKTELTNIQSDLFEIGSQLASPNYSSSEAQAKSRSSRQARTIQKRVKDFETIIDDMTRKSPELRNFILPGGGITGSHLHLARAVARRAERRIVALSKKENIDGRILIYFNRLSDLLFTMARFVNHKEKQKETIWKTSKV